MAMATAYHSCRVGLPLGVVGALEGVALRPWRHWTVEMWHGPQDTRDFPFPSLNLQRGLVILAL